MNLSLTHTIIVIIILIILITVTISFLICVTSKDEDKHILETSYCIVHEDRLYCRLDKFKNLPYITNK